MKTGQSNPMTKVHCKKMAGKQEYGILPCDHNHTLFLYAKVAPPYPDKDTSFHFSFTRIRYGCGMNFM